MPAFVSVLGHVPAPTEDSCRGDQTQSVHPGQDVVGSRRVAGRRAAREVVDRDVQQARVESIVAGAVSLVSALAALVVFGVVALAFAFNRLD